MSENHKKIIESIDIMLSDNILQMQFYGEFCQFINFSKDRDIETCGVSIDINGLNFIFNDHFIDTLTLGEMNFVMMHEISHLLWNHSQRIRRGGYENGLSNVAQDMIINESIVSDIITRLKNINKKENKHIQFAEIPKNKETQKCWVLRLPSEYTGKLIFEELYEWLFSQKVLYDKWKNNFNKQSDDCPVSDYLQKIFEQLDNGIKNFLDVHIPSEISQEYEQNIINDIIIHILINNIIIS
jgi:predicted metal-dependent peptidase